MFKDKIIFLKLMKAKATLCYIQEMMNAAVIFVSGANFFHKKCGPLASSRLTWPYSFSAGHTMSFHGLSVTDISTSF